MGSCRVRALFGDFFNPEFTFIKEERIDLGIQSYGRKGKNGSR